MKIIKRDGTEQALSFDKILYRITNLCTDKTLGILNNVEIDAIVQKVIVSIFDGVTSYELDEEAARICAGITRNESYRQLASRIIISNMQKSTSNTFIEASRELFEAGVVAKEYYSVIADKGPIIESMIVYNRDYLFDYFGYKTLEKSYLLKINGKLVERPQYMYMRVALAIHKNDLVNVAKTYDLLSNHYYTHASPTLFNAGTNTQSLSSCFLLGTNDSMDAIYKTISDCAKISRLGGGIGVHVSNIRAKGSAIRGINGTSDGIVPMLKVYNETAAYVNQGSKRKGSFAIYLEPWHPEIFDFLELKKNQGAEERRARNLFYSIWTPDYFMRQVESNGDWWLMCPDECHGLDNVYGKDFDKLYDYYIEQGMFKRKVPARDIWNRILEAQIESGVPYIGYKDAVNKKCNQKNLGTIKSSNLCVAPETMILTDKGHFEIKGLEGQTVNVWNGQEFTSTTVFKTGENQELIKVVLSNGSEVECTRYHKFHIVSKVGGISIVEAKDLKLYMTLIDTDFPTIASDSDIKWLTELLKSDRSNDPSIRIKEELDVLKKARYILQTLGCDGFIEGELNPGGGPELNICAMDVSKLIDAGFELNKEYKVYVNQGRLPVTVSKVIETGRISDTYCFTEEKRGLGIFNGVITGQCSEISLYSDENNYAVCNLCSIALPKFAKKDSEGAPFFDFELLHSVGKSTILSMNRVIDNNHYPTPETRKTDNENRPLGIGVQGLVDVYIKMRMPFESVEARELNKRIFETLYHSLLEASIELSKVSGPYLSFDGSPFSDGKLQFDLAKEFDGVDLNDYISDRYDWEKIRMDIKTYGIRNSMLTALMPTASTAQIMCNSESFEVMNSCIFKRRVLSGEFMILNKYLVQDLTELNLWSDNMKDKIIIADGSIQRIPEIPQNLKELYKTAWEISMKAVIDQCSDRGVFIDQMQSMNLYMANPTIKKLSSMHFYAWKKHLKTGIYYLRSKSVASSGKFSVNPEMEKQAREAEALQCSIDNKEECLMCSS